ncbi:hypothetical protein B9Z55_003490 [Caenorhabditis nigoni]|uniref:non-specific serine/threonine protein kinase n=1 Tax=Caenorhabditis nigoni TaxID=1611254 RepID=A0A2G5VR30_9PELO|nr:hypothetical protein B9Z55_003490 [Caenorhabditis nigoni]
MTTSSESPESQDSEPLNFKNYSILQPLGIGNFGAVSLILTRKSKKYAMKELFLEENEENDPFEEFENHFLVSSSAHPNILKMYKMSNDDEDGICRFFMEYVDSGNLFERIQENLENGFSEKLALKFYRQLIFGLEHIHGMGIAHLDIRPENLMLTRDDTLKISDFGLSVRFKDRNGLPMLVETSGSALYRSPECRKCALIDGPKSDIFSSGVVLVEMLNGCYPWEEATVTDVNYKKWLDGIGDMGWKNAGEQVMAFLRKILSDDLEKRATILEIKLDGWFQQQNYSNPENSRKRKIARNEQSEKRTKLATILTI